MKAANHNAVAIIELDPHGNGLARTVTVDCRVTAKRVYTLTRTYDLATGKVLTPYRPSMSKRKLVRVTMRDGSVVFKRKAPQS